MRSFILSLIFLFPLLIQAQLRNIKGSHSISFHIEGINSELGGEALGVGYQYNLSRNEHLSVYLSAERILFLEQVERIIYERSVDPLLGPRLIEVPITEERSSDYSAYYLRLAYKKLLTDMGDKLYLYYGLSGRGGYEFALEDDFQAGGGGLIEMEIFISPKMGLFFHSYLDYMPISEIAFRFGAKAGIKISL